MNPIGGGCGYSSPLKANVNGNADVRQQLARPVLPVWSVWTPKPVSCSGEYKGTPAAGGVARDPDSDREGR